MRLRLLLSFTLVVLVSVTGVVVFARQGVARTVRTFMVRGAMIGSDELVADLQAYYLENGSWQGVDVVLSGLGWGQGQGQGMMHGQGQGMMMGQRLRLADAQGTVVADSSALPSGSLGPSDLESAIPIVINGQTVGYLTWQGGMAFTVADQTFLVGRLTRAAVSAGVIAGGLSLLLALLLSYNIMRPVRELTQAARRFGDRDLSQRVRVRGKDELAELASTFNRMADSLAQAEDSRRALTADIAHELRTPLAVQRANLEAIQDGVYPLSPDNLAAVLEQNLLLTRLVDDLRTLALADAGQLTLERTMTDIPELLDRVVERFQSQAAARQISLRLEPVSKVAQYQISVDPQRIEQILANLLSNALRHTPEAGQITVRITPMPAKVAETAAASKTAAVTDTVPVAENAVVVTTTGLGQNDLWISVHDSGPGIPQEALPHVFERFYRADRSRSRSEGGSGLGLAIARQLAEAHGGSLTVANHSQGGAIFTLTLPVGNQSLFDTRV